MALYRYKGQPTHYTITKECVVTNINTNNVLKGTINKHGYRVYTIQLESGVSKKILAHRMLMETFCPNANSDILTINHIDGNKLNNSLSNLEWCTREDNLKKARETGLNDNKKQPIYAFNDNLELVGSWQSLQELTRMTNFSYTIICHQCHEPVRSKIYGYYWSYSKEPDFQIAEYKNIGVARPIKQLDKNGNLIAIYKSRGEAARALGVNGGHITECCQHKLASYKGYIWEYLE